MFTFSFFGSFCLPSKILEITENMKARPAKTKME